MKIALLTTDNREHYADYAHPRPYFGTAPEALLQGLAALPELEVHVVSCLQRPVSSPKQIASNVFYHSLVVSKPGWMRTLYAGCVLATRRKLREIRPDIVHGQGTERDCALAAACGGFPSVITIHGNMQAVAERLQARPGGFHWLATRLEDFSLWRTAGVFCNSAYTEKLAAPRAQKTWRVPNALREDFFVPRAVKTPNAVPVLLNIGVVQPYKQQLEVLRVVRRLHAQGLRFEFQFVGALAPGTAYGNAFAKELADAEKAGFVRHLGLLSMPQLIPVMDTADALLHFPTEEAFGLVVAEALARNLKLFAATTGGVADIVEGVADAELFAATDFGGLENALARWLAAGGPPPANAAELMQARYHPKIVAQRHLEIYREVLSGPGR